MSTEREENVMSGIGDIWRQAAAKWTEVSAQVTDDDWDKPTTCEEWTVRDLVGHAMHWQAMGGGIVGAGTAPGDDWATTEPRLSAALDDPSNLEGTAEAMGGMPKQQVAGFLIGDLVIHAWDLARSIGADDTLPVGAVEATLMGLQRVPPETLRSSKMFGEPVDVADDASPQDRLLAFVGRTP
jgi:uncharacterized protein (TIGR03086 family)